MYGVDYCNSRKNSMNKSIIKITNDLWAIKDTTTTEEVFWYVLKGSKKTLVFDTGIGIAPILPIVRQLSDQPIITILSHAHFDHVGGAHEFSDVFAWDHGEMRSASMNGVSNNVIRTYVGEDFWEHVPYNLAVQPFPNANYLNHTSSIDLGNYHLDVIHTPGHCPSSICLYEKTCGWLFTGDTVYEGPIYLHLPESNRSDYSKSIDTLLSLQARKIFPGHNSTNLEPSILTDIRHLLDGQQKTNAYPRLTIL